MDMSLTFVNLGSSLGYKPESNRPARIHSANEGISPTKQPSRCHARVRVHDQCYDLHERNEAELFWRFVLRRGYAGQA